MYGRDLRKSPRRAYWAGLLIGCFMSTGYAFQTMGIHLTTPSKAAFITGFSVVLVPVFLGVFGRTRISPGRLGGRLCRVSGPLLRHRTGRGRWQSEFRRSTGPVLHSPVCPPHHYRGALFAALSRRRAGPATGRLYCDLYLGVAIPLASVSHIERPRLSWNSTLIAAVLITGIFATALAFAGQVWAQRHTHASHVAIIFSLEPVFAAITSYVFYHERMTGRVLLGAALILGGNLHRGASWPRAYVGRVFSGPVAGNELICLYE